MLGPALLDDPWATIPLSCASVSTPPVYCGQQLVVFAESAAGLGELAGACVAELASIRA
jgi:hypothetical protein